MDLKGAEIRNINELCGAINSKEVIPMRVVIPFYQRPYKWGSDNIQKLFDDFDKNDCKEYFVGSVVMVTPSGKDRYSVIDGQQRITTMFLIEYLRYLLLRSHIETLLSHRKTTKVDSLLTELTLLAGNLFGDGYKKQICLVHKTIVEQLDRSAEDKKDDTFYDSLLSDYQKTTFLPESKDYTDLDSYGKEFGKLLQDMFNSCELALSYSRESYNKKLIKALSNIYVKVTDTEIPSIHRVEDAGDNLIDQYINAVFAEFRCLSEKLPYDSTKQNPLEYTSSLIEWMKNIIHNIRFCVIITGNEKDAYTLFEVLNDRALEIDDLDLIKNLFYKWYCNHTNEAESVIDKCIEEVDRLWVEEIFTQVTGVENSKLISFLTAEYLTADDALKYADTAKYRETIESNYLESYPMYNSTSIKNDIGIYQLVAMIVKKFKFATNKKGEAVIKAEESDYSITYKTLHLLNALKQYGVMPAITNAIVRKFVDNHTSSSGLINIGEFDEYLTRLISDKTHSDPEFKQIHDYSHVFWRLSLMCKNADTPRDEAKKIINSINAKSNNYSYVLDANKNQKLLADFAIWMSDWRYGKSDDELKAKVLFINLFHKVKNDQNQLVIQPFVTKPITTELHLDHLEAKSTTANYSGFYFTPKNPGEPREMYVNSIGNFMILDSDNNNGKSNLPICKALQFYDNMCKDHWLIKEIDFLLTSDKNCFKTKIIDGEEWHIPTEDFFRIRREHLTKYFSAILRMGLADTSVNI